MIPFVSLDIETTGVDGSARVIEIGAIVVTEAGELAARAHTLIRQDAIHLQRPASLAAQKIHGIAPAVLLDPSPPTEAEAAEKLRRWLAAAAERYGARQLRAWNLPFERRFLSRSPWGLEGWGECLMAFAARNVEGAKGGKLKLEEAARTLQIPRPGGVQHRALADAIRAALVVVHLEQQIEEEAPLWSGRIRRPAPPSRPPAPEARESDLFARPPSPPSTLPALPPEVQSRPQASPVPPADSTLLPVALLDPAQEYARHGCLWWRRPQPGWEYSPKEPAPVRATPWIPPLARPSETV